MAKKKTASPKRVDQQLVEIITPLTVDITDVVSRMVSIQEGQGRTTDRILQLLSEHLALVYGLCERCRINAGRCLDAEGKRTCTLCPLALKIDQIRLSDVPALLAWCRTFLRMADAETSPNYDYEGLRNIIGKDPAV